MQSKKLIGIFVALLTSAVLADVCLSLFFVRDGIFLGQPLPPFDSMTHPKQRLWLAGLERQGSTGIGRFDGELGWSWRPSSISLDGKFEIDARGARGPREYADSPPPGVRRLVTFGDSFTFGDEIPGTGTFQSILEARHPDWEVINFGVSGYGTDQALLRYRRLGRDLGAEVVCIGILLENIGRNVNRYRPLWTPSTGFCATKPRFVLDDHGELRLIPQPFADLDALRDALESRTVVRAIADHEYWLDRPPLRSGRLSSVARILAAVEGQRQRDPTRLWREPEGEPFRVTIALLQRFHDEAIADGARLAPILVFPSKEDLREWGLAGRSFWSELLAELDRRGLPYIDLIPPLVRREQELRRDPSGGTLYFGGHLSSVGNGVVAAELDRWLSSQ